MAPFVNIFPSQLLSTHRRRIVFLDPFGLKGLEADLVAEALDGEAREVLVLFNDPGAGRLGGASGALSSPAARTEETWDLFSELNRPGFSGGSVR